MAHEHNLIDSDVCFTIDPQTRIITGEKEEIVQFDHNSERITFKMPKTIEGHDMSQCDSIEIHYENVKGGESNSDFYKVTDLQSDSSDSDSLIFSWLISQNATQLDGLVKFSIKFACHDENGAEIYRLGTKKCSLISVSESYDNTELVLELYSDAISVLESQIEEIIEAEHVHENIKTLANFYDEVAENDGIVIGSGLHRLKYNNNQIRYIGDGKVILDVQDIEENGQQIRRVYFTDDTPNVDIGTEVNYFDIPLDTALTDEQLATAIENYLAENPVIENVEQTVEKEVKTVGFGDLNATDSVSVTTAGTFWLTDIDEMVSVRGCTLKSITIYAQSSDTTITVRGTNTIIDKYSTHNNAVNLSSQANSTAVDIFTINTTEGISTYLLDGTDNRVTILNADFVENIPNTLGLTKTGDNGTYYYLKNGEEKGYYAFTYHDGGNSANQYYNTTQELCFDLEIETLGTNNLVFTKSDNSVIKIGIPNGITSNNGILCGKKISIIGDSISTYSGYIPDGYVAYYPNTNSDITSVDQTWWKALCDETDMELLVNASYSGSYVTGDSTSTTSALSSCSDKRIADLTDGTNTPDIIVCYIGTNDFGQSVHRQLGDYKGRTVVPTEGTIETLSEAYGLMISKIMTAYPNAKVYCCSLLEISSTNWDTGDNGLFPTINNNNVAIADFNERIEILAKAFGAGFIDLHSCGINYFNLSVYTHDGLHPNTDGAVLIKNAVKSALLNDFNY